MLRWKKDCAESARELDLLATAFDLIPPNRVTHFVPNETFLQWMTDYLGGRFAMEVGAGQCEFAKALIARGNKVLAIEPRPNEQVLMECSNFLLPLPVQRAGMLRDTPAVVISARPDHSGWFGELLDIIHPDSILVYIGLDKNLDIDIPVAAELITLYEGAGEDGEVAYEVRRI